MSAYTAPRLPIVTTIEGIRALTTRRDSSSHSSSGVRPLKSQTNRMPASCALQTKQSIDCRKSRRCEAMDMFATTAYTFLWYFPAYLKTVLISSLSRSISMTILSASANISSPFSSSMRSIASEVGRLDIEPAMSPPLLNTASHMPMPSCVTAT